MLQTLFTSFIPYPYNFLPGAVFITIVSAPNVLRWLGLSSESKEATPIIGKTAAYLDFANPSHAGKQPGYSAFTTPHEQRAPQLAVMLIGSQCRSSLGAVQPEFKEMGEVFASMIEELRAAPPEDDVGFLNAEFYMHGGRSANNSNMVSCPSYPSFSPQQCFAYGI